MFKYRRIRKLVSAILVLCILAILPGMTVMADTSGAVLTMARKADRTVRVFYPLQTGLTEQDEDGNYSGFAYEYLMRIAQLTGWKYEFTAVKATNETLTAGMEAVKNGELDLMGSMVYSPQLEADYLFSSVPYGEANYALITPKENKLLNDRTVFGYSELKVALVEKAPRENQLLQDYCQSKGVRFSAVYAQSTAECRKLVESGQADAMIGKDIALAAGYKMIFQFSSQPFYFATSKENTELMAELNQALIAINSAEPGLQAELYQKYFSITSDYNFSLTKDELEFVEGASPIRVAIPTGRAPIQDYERDGSFEGIMIDVLEKISQQSGLSFELVPAEDKGQAEAMLRAGQVNMIAGMPYTILLADESVNSNILLTSPVYSMPIVRITNSSNKVKSDKILVYENIKQFVEQDNIQYEDDTKEILELMEKGSYAEAYVNGYMAQYYLAKGNFHNIIITPTPYHQYEVCIGVARGEDLRLINIMEQTISALPPEALEQIIFRNTAHLSPVGC